MTGLGVPFGVEDPACPVCDEPGGNCGPHDGSDDRPDHVQFEEWGKGFRPPSERSPNMAAGDVVAADRIWENVPVPRSQRTSKTLRYKPGDVILAEDAKRLGVGADGTQKSIPTAEPGSTGPVPLAAKKAPAKKTAAAKKAPAKRATKAAKKATKATKKG